MRARSLGGHLGEMSSWLQHRRDRAALIGSLVAPLVVAAALGAWRASIPSVAAVLAMVVVVAAVATSGTRAAGFMASLGAALWFDFFLTAPYQRLAISHRPDLEATIGIVVVGVVVTELAARSRSHWRAAHQSFEFVAELHHLADACVGTAPFDDVIDEASTFLTSLLGLRQCRFERALVEPPLARLDAAGEVRHVGMRWASEVIGIPGPESEIIVRWRGQPVGRFVITPTPGEPVARARRVAAVTVVDVVAGRVAAWRNAQPLADRGRS